MAGYHRAVITSAVRRTRIGIGGIATIDDVMEFLVAGASAVQIGTANYYDPTVSMKLLDQLPEAVASLGVKSVREVVGTLTTTLAKHQTPNTKH